MTSDSTGATVGENLHRLRILAGESQAEAAQRLARHGLDWKRDHVAALENGRRASVAVDELVIMSSAYGVRLDEWFAGHGDVQLSPAISVDRSEIRDVLRGKGILRAATPRELDFSDAEDLEADERVAKRLGVETQEVTRIAHELWGHSLTQERNRRLADSPAKDPKAMRTVRGGMTKRLLREVELHMKEKE